MSDEEIERLEQRLKKLRLEKQILEEERSLDQFNRNVGVTSINSPPKKNPIRMPSSTSSLNIPEQPVSNFKNHYAEPVVQKPTYLANRGNKQLNLDNNFGTAFNNVIKRLFTFEGRVGRLQFFYSLLAIIGLIYLPALLFLVLHRFETILFLFAALYIIPAISTLLFIFSITVRRLHDLNKSGIFLIFYFLALFVLRGLLLVSGLDVSTQNGIILLIWFTPWLMYLQFFPAVDNSQGANKYGKISHRVFSTKKFINK